MLLGGDADGIEVNCGNMLLVCMERDANGLEERWRRYEDKSGRLAEVLMRLR